MSDLILVEKSRAGFFVTGNEYIRDNLNLKFMPRANLCEDDSRGVILATDNQTLQQSFDVAKDFFAQSEPGTIRFVLIGLSPYNFSVNGKEPPTACPIEEKVLDNYFKLCVDNGAKPVCVVLPVNAAVKKTYNANVLKAFRDSINKVVKKYKASFVDLLDVKLANKLFQNKSRLNSEGAAAVTALLGSRLYLAKVISVGDILEMGNEYFNVLSGYFSGDYVTLIHHAFCRMACDDFARLSKILPNDECKDLMARVFSELTYNHLANLSNMLSKDDYNDLTARIFEISAEKIRHKDKIKVGFHFDYSSFYFGDDLYNLFAKDERFEPTLFVNTKSSNSTIDNERSQDAKRFTEHGIHIFDLDNQYLSIPVQDVLFCLTPYQIAVPVPFRIVNLKVTTLLVSFSYSLSVADRGSLLNSVFFRVLYKKFASSPVEFELLREKNKVFTEHRVIYSGYPKMDIFFRKDANFKFNWKIVHPKAKKIIWAPHHSIVNNGPLFATFQWNYKFMYEFAKAHPETSWIVKAHTHLPKKVIVSKLFPNIESYKEYIQKWEDLPNAQVYMGAYYQSIFATSDGMIQDCGSFIAEYQYVDKPMIYLTRDTQKFNELGNEILKASYTVDGQDLDAIAAMIQRVFIEGDDYKAAERKAVFEKYLDYYKANGMLASEFIYKNIADELKPPTT